MPQPARIRVERIARVLRGRPFYWSLIALLGLCAAGCDSHSRERSVVLVVIDTLRADHLSLQGYARSTSPALERWGARGVVFERALATSSWTLPSFGSLLTGRRPARHAAGLRLGPPGGGIARLSDDVATLAETLRARGYATAARVANPYLVERFGLSRGFDSYENQPVTNQRVRRAPRIFDDSLRWIRAQEQRPFFLLVHVFDPHMDYDPPKEVRGSFTGNLESALSLPVSEFRELRQQGALPARDQAFVQAAYDEEILAVDRALDAFLQALSDEGVLDRSLLVLTADHGEELFDHGGFEHGHTLYQELLHVPLLFLGEGLTPARVATPVSLIDVLPTVAEAVGAPIPPGAEGTSLWPLLRGDPGPLPDRALWAESTLYGPPLAAIVRWPYKLVIGGTAPLLFDLEKDPAERRDLAAAEPERAAALEAELRAQLQRAAQESPPRQAATIDDEVREQLRALGYLAR